MRTISAILIVLLMGLSAIPSMMVSAVNHPPTAEAGPEKKCGVGETVYFDGTASADPDGNALNYSWDFDDADGIQSDATEAIASHTYMDEGTFTVTLTVTDGNLTDTDTTMVTVSQDHRNQAPTAVIEEPSNFAIFNTTTEITFSGNGSSDPDGDLLTYEWDFGDGKSANGMIVKHTYADAGVYNVNLSVSDGELSSTAGITVLINGGISGPGGPPPIPTPNLPGKPVADPGGPYNYPTYEEVQLDGSRSKGGGSGKLEYCWDLNARDGIQAQWCFDATAAKEHYWQVAYGSSPVVAYREPGNYTITLIIREMPWVDQNPIYYYGAPATVNANIFPHMGSLVDAGKDRTIKNGEKTNLMGRVFIDPAIEKWQDERVVGCGWDFTNDSTIDFSLEFDATENLKTASCPAVHTYTVNGTTKNDTIFTPRLQGVFSGKLSLSPASDTEIITVPYMINNNDTVKYTVPAPPNKNPVVSCGPDKVGSSSAFVGEETRFTATAIDPDKDRIINWEWDFQGDGAIEYSNPASGDASYTYTSQGNFVAIVNATDERHGFGLCWVNVTVIANINPVAKISAPDSGKAGEEIEFDGSDSYDDNGASEIVSYSWDFDAKDGVTTDASGPIVTHVFAKGEGYTVTLIVRDKHGGEGTATSDIKIVQTYGVSIENSGASSVELDPGKSQVFNLKLTNSGNGDDCFDLTKTGTKSTWGDVSINSACLKAGEIRSITLRVTVPTSSEAGDQATIKIDAVSQGSSDAKDDVSIRVTANQDYGVQAHMEETATEIKAGEAKTLSLRITNMGNGKDTIKFSADGTDKTWISFKADSLSMDPAETKETTITITVPDDAKGGDHAITIIAYCVGDNAQKTSIIVTVKVKEKTKTGIPGFEPASVLLALALAFVAIGAWKKKNA